MKYFVTYLLEGKYTLGDKFTAVSGVVTECDKAIYDYLGDTFGSSGWFTFSKEGVETKPKAKTKVAPKAKAKPKAKVEAEPKARDK